MVCPSCEAKQLCSKCDNIWHSHPKRKDHIRTQISNASQPSSSQTGQSLHHSISHKQYQDASEMDLNKIESILRDLRHTLESMKSEENLNAKKKELTSKYNIFKDVYIKKLDKEIEMLNQHKDNVDRHIQALVLNDRDFYEREDYSNLTKDKQFTQKKINECREKQNLIQRHKTIQLLSDSQEYGYMSDSVFNRYNHCYKDTSVMSAYSYFNRDKVCKLPIASNDLCLDLPESDSFNEHEHLGRSPLKSSPLISSYGTIFGEDSEFSYWKCSLCGHKNCADIENCVNCDRHKDGKKETPVSEENENISTTFQTVAAEQDQILLEKKIAQQQYRNSIAASSCDFEFTPEIAKRSPSLTLDQPCVNIPEDTKPLSFSKVDKTHVPSQSHHKNERSKTSPVVENKKEEMKVSSEMLAIEEKKNRMEMISKTIVKKLRLAEQQGIDVDTMLIALENVDDSLTPMEWIQKQWPDYITTATVMIDNQIGVQFHKEEVTVALRKHKGNVEKAVEECTHSYHKMLKKLRDFGKFSDADFKQAFQKYGGNADLILQALFTPCLDEYQKRIWVNNETLNSSLSVDLINLLKDNQVDSQRRVRAAYTEISFKGWRRAEYVISIIDKSLQTLENVDVPDIVEIVQNTTSMGLALKQLQIECKICFINHPQTKIMTLCSCDCKFCVSCFQGYFDYKINNDSVITWTCPLCFLPKFTDSETDGDYFNILGLQIKQHGLNPKTITLYETKLRDWHLQRDPNFRWCQKCGFGFLFDGKGLKMTCPNCKSATCFKCTKEWREQHMNLSCEKYNEWLVDNNPKNQAQGLDNILKQNGITCPQCKFVYYLSKGGCIHFTCKECRYQFCSGCLKKFYSKAECNKYKSCSTKGIHAHHPRNCLYYLRDNTIPELQKLLQMNQINFDTVSNESLNVCAVVEQKEMASDSFEDAKCGKDVLPNHAGFCQEHYKEYLITLINKHRVDPVILFSKENIKQVLSRYDKIPPDQVNQSDSEYMSSLQKLLHQVEPIS
ncbi:E3 ubiquitin-protein ligase RNF31 isoform X1 [Argonauta hians]